MALGDPPGGIMAQHWGFPMRLAPVAHTPCFLLTGAVPLLMYSDGRTPAISPKVE